jgi:hypothetical protein
MDLEMSAIETDPFGYLAKLKQEFVGACELLLVHDRAIRNLVAENQRLHERLAALEAANRISRRDDEQPSERELLPQLH